MKVLEDHIIFVKALVEEETTLLLPDASSAGYLWNFDSLQEQDGLKVLKVEPADVNPKAIPSYTHINVVFIGTKAGIYCFEQTRPWSGEVLNQVTIELS